MKTVLHEATGDLVAKFSVRLMKPSPETKPSEIEMQVRQTVPKLNLNGVLGDGELEIWGYVATGFEISVEPPFGKKLHRRGWCAL